MPSLSRLSMLRAAGQKLGLTPANVGFMPVSAAEVAETIQSVVRHERPHSILDEEQEGATPGIERVFAAIRREQVIEDGAKGRSRKQQADSILLAKAEKARLQREVDAYRWAQGKARGCWLVAV